MPGCPDRQPGGAVAAYRPPCGKYPMWGGGMAEPLAVVPAGVGGSATGSVAQVVNRALAEFVSREVAALAATDPELGRFGRTAAEWVLSGGKRLRPTFAHWGLRGLVGLDAPLDPVLPALAALELFHASALAQDDLMDGSATRRGRPTVHRALADQHVACGRTGGADRFGTAAAVLVGDLCLVWADRLLATAALPARALLDARRCYDQMRVDVIAGQDLDVVGATDAGSWSLGRALLVARLKTASYTVQRPLLFGAALVGRRPDARVTAAYDAYGRAVGERSSSATICWARSVTRPCPASRPATTRTCCGAAASRVCCWLVRLVGLSAGGLAGRGGGGGQG